ncbi:uncharacterized protein LOC120768656 [Bactrocera tryoni]|uniref:uncharacterized protein LOC120768656 n=1 Tax=Bactrocera tryoni TaxID=59916 RepID=UPI001A975520|nr:uncharacterized protein LOC120768656 [Bactrocera tryoni]
MEIEDEFTLFNKFENKFFGEMIKFKARLREWRIIVMVLAYSEKHDYLDARKPSTLTHCIVNSYAANAVKITYSEKQKWAKAISEVFPKEKAETYIYTAKI